MGLKDRLQQNGSSLTAYDGNNPSINPLTTNQSSLHATPSGQPGYSLSGANVSTVNSQYIQYQDGSPNYIPSPTNLDSNNGVTPYSYLQNPPH